VTKFWKVPNRDSQRLAPRAKKIGGGDKAQRAQAERMTHFTGKGGEPKGPKNTFKVGAKLLKKGFSKPLPGRKTGITNGGGNKRKQRGAGENQHRTRRYQKSEESNLPERYGQKKKVEESGSPSPQRWENRG